MQSFQVFLRGLTDRECGTLKDPNYRAAFYALQDATEFCFQGRLIDGSFRESYFFPKASDSILDEAGNSVFYYEGSLSWEASGSSWLTSHDDLLCKRVMRKAVQIDVPVCVFEGEDKPCFIHLDPFLWKRSEFLLYKDYSALLSVFYALQQDVAFICENNKAFLHRRIQDSNRYYKPGLLDGYIPLRIKDLKKDIKYYAQQYQRNSQHIEKCQEKQRFIAKGH